MVHPLKRIPRAPVPMTVRRVDTQTLADRLTKAARSRQILPEHLSKEAPLRCYVALHGDVPIGWVSSIVVSDSTWCSNMYVKPRHPGSRLPAGALRRLR